MIAWSVQNVSFYYGNKKIIDNVSFDINAGDFVCVIGSNGTGKSTLLKLMLNLLTPHSGHIQCRINPIAYVSQNTTAFNKNFPATVEEVVGLNLHDKKPQQITEALEMVDMQNHRCKLIGELSGGQKQRVMLAKALATKPKCILLDEPTSGIDNVDSLCCLLGDLNKSMTIIMVTHDIFSVINHATKVINLNHDKITIHDAFDYKL